MDDPKIFKDLLTELECPVCYDYIAPPVRQCSNVHPICQSCFSKVDKCPVCRQAKALTRNHVLEKLYMMLDIPCQYRYEGCDYVVKGKLIKTHQATCLYRPVPCPMAPLRGCLWTGPKTKIEEHCKKNHADYVIFGIEACLVAAGFKNINTSAKYIAIFYAYETIFRLYWRANAKTGEVRFSVTFSGSPEDDDRFSFKIRFVRRKSSRVARSLFGTCRYVSDSRILAISESTVGTSLDLITDYCIGEGDLQFFVRIRDNSVSVADGPGQPS